MYLDRIRNVTEGFAIRNQERLKSLVVQGLDSYVSDDYIRCRESLELVESLLSHDPEQARDENIRVTSLLRSLNSRARENRRASQVAEREAAQAAVDAERSAALEQLAADRDARAEEVSQEKTMRESLLEMVRTARRSMPGSIQRDLCQPDFKAISVEIENCKVIPHEFEQVRFKLESRIAALIANANLKVEEQMLAAQFDEERSEMLDNLEDALMVYTRLGDDGAQTAIKMLQSHLAEKQVTVKFVDENLATIRQEADDRAIQEAARRHVVSGLLRELRNAGFVVSEPKLEGGEPSAVLLMAQRPSGAQAAFRVNLDGMTYKFDHYQGDACLQDAHKIMPKLQEIYGIELEDERVSWRNPDMIGKSEKRIPDSAGERRK